MVMGLVIMVIRHRVVMNTSMYHHQRRQPFTVHIHVRVVTEIHHIRDQKTKLSITVVKLKNTYAHTHKQITLSSALNGIIHVRT